MERKNRGYFANKKVQVGKAQEKAQSEKDSHSKNRGGSKRIVTLGHYNQNVHF